MLNGAGCSSCCPGAVGSCTWLMGAGVRLSYEGGGSEAEGDGGGG